MALLDSEIARIKSELGYNALTVGALPYVGTVTMIFEQAIQPYVGHGVTVTSATAVSAATTPTPATIVLSSATGVTVYDTLVIDVDARQERATLQAITSTSATVLLSLAHSGTYPVTVEGGESIIRELLQKLRAISAPNGPIERLSKRGGVLKVDEITLAINPRTGRSSGIADLLALQDYYRDELAGQLNVQRLNRRGGGAGSGLAAY